MPTDNETILELEDLTAEIGRQVILESVGLEIARGECVAVVGGSGAGKSTLLRCLMGLRKPARPVSGRLRLFGRNIDFSKRARSARFEGVGFVPQNPDHGFDPLKRLSRQWRLAARCVGRADGRAFPRRELLEALGLPLPGRRFPHEWSRGMQQRLLLAIALLGDPGLLVLDEPTSALDPIVCAQVLSEVMAHARAREAAVLIVTHDLALADRFASRTAVMDAGRIAEFGPTQRLLQDPQSPCGRLLVSNRHWGLPEPGLQTANLATV